MSRQARKQLWKLGIILAILGGGRLLLHTALRPDSPDAQFKKVRIDRGEISQEF